MWALQLYIGFFSQLPLTIPGAHGIHFSNRLQPRDQHPAAYIMAVPRPLFILGPRGPLFFHIMARYAHAFSHFCKYKLIPFDNSSDIGHLGYLVVMCAGTCASVIDIIPSGISPALACSPSH
jgi:hypothetical protein